MEGRLAVPSIPGRGSSAGCGGAGGSRAPSAHQPERSRSPAASTTRLPRSTAQQRSRGATWAENPKSQNPKAKNQKPKAESRKPKAKTTSQQANHELKLRRSSTKPRSSSYLRVARSLPAEARRRRRSGLLPRALASEARPSRRHPREAAEGALQHRAAEPSADGGRRRREQGRARRARRGGVERAEQAEVVGRADPTNEERWVALPPSRAKHRTPPARRPPFTRPALPMGPPRPPAVPV